MALALLGGTAVRLYGLGWGLPYHFHNDEYTLAHFTETLRTAGSLEQLTRDVKFFLYPPLPMYLLIALVRLAAVVHPFSPADPGSVTLYYVLGRLVAAGFGAATLVAVYLLGARLYAREVGTLAAVFLAFSVLHVRDSHFYAPDVPFTFFVVLTTVATAAIAQGSGTAPYLMAGACVGFGLATKQTTLLVLPVVVMAHVIRMRRGESPAGGGPARLLRSRRFWGLSLLPLAVAGATFLVLDPFVILAPEKFLAMSRQTAQFVRGATQPTYTFQFTDTTILYWLTNLLYFAMGPVLEVVSLAGLGWALVKRRPADLLLLAFVVPYLAVVATGYMKFVRYAIPLLPFLCLLGARLLVEALAAVHHRLGRAAVVTATAGVIAASGLYTVAYLNVYRERDARIQASEWIHRNIPRDSTVLIDSASSTPLLGSLHFHPTLEASYRRRYAKKHDHFVIKTMNLIVEPQELPHPNSPEWWEGYLRERLEDVEYIIMSDEYREQYSHRPAEYPTLNRFYQDLFSGRSGYELVKTFKVYPALFGHRWNDDRAELTFRLFDHPHIMVFRRRPNGRPHRDDRSAPAPARPGGTPGRPAGPPEPDDQTSGGGPCRFLDTVDIFFCVNYRVSKVLLRKIERAHEFG